MKTVNTLISDTYWQIERDILGLEQGGKVRAGCGKGFSRNNVSRFRLSYVAYPICATPSHKLSGSVISELLKIEDPLERGLYEQQCLRENWVVRELKRQKKTSHVRRLAAGKDKDAILQLASQGQIINEPSDLLTSVR